VTNGQDKILDEIDESPELILFFKRLFENSTYQKLFFNHRDVLFFHIENVLAPFFFWNNLDESSQASRTIRVISTFAEISEIKKERASSFFTNLLLNASDEVKDILAFAIIKFVRENKNVIDLVTAPHFTFQRMKQLLGDYSSLNLNIFDKLEESNSTYDPVFEARGKKIAEAFQRSFKDFTEEFIESVSDSASDPIMGYHLEGEKHLSRLLKTSSLPKLTYLDLLTELHSQHNIFTFHSVIWCNSCVDNPIIISTKSEISPHHLSMPCPRCREQMVASTFYSLDSTIRDSIFSKNGLLGLSVEWLLRKNGLDYRSTSYNKHEHDFIVTTPTVDLLIECKMHRNDNVDEKNVMMWLEQDLSQVSEQLKELNKTTKTSGILIYNFQVAPYETIADELIKTKYDSVKLTDYQGVGNILAELKPQS